MQTEPLQITRVSSISELDTHRDAWRELAAHAPMLSPEWLLTWWEVYAMPSDELCILLIHEPGGFLVGLAPLYLQDAKGKAILHLLGSANDCTHHVTWLSAPGYETQVGIEVAKSLLQHKQNWKRMLLEAVDAEAEAIYATVKHLAEKGCLYHQRRINNVWKIPLPKKWDDYLMMLSRSHRKRCRKLQRQFLDSGKIQIRQVENEVDLERGVEILQQLHGTRWGNPSKPQGIFTDKRFRRFHEIITGKLMAAGQLRLAWLEYNGRPLAIEYQFFDSRSVYAYQAGLDLSMNQFSPGRLSMIAAIQFAIARGCKFFDLLRGDDPYKSNWRAQSSACFDIRVWPNSIGNYPEYILWSIHTLGVKWLKPLLPDRIIRLGLNFLNSLRKS